MESASASLARSLPPLVRMGGALEPSISNERLCASYMHLWSDFTEEILSALRSLSLERGISINNPHEGEKYVVGSELGLTTRFARNICDPVARALSVTEMSHLQFGDIQAFKQDTDSSKVPHITLAMLNSPYTASIIAAGELKTSWTFDLRQTPVTLPIESRRNLETRIGQVVSYMRAYNLKFGFLSTYDSTVFLKRVSDYRFLLSLPVPQEATEPSVRECFAGFSILASDDPHYFEGPDVNTWLLRAHTQSGYQASMRPSQYRLRSGPLCSEFGPTFIPGSITTESILIGLEGKAVTHAKCVRRISSTSWKDTKAVFEVEFQGMACIAKCWSPEIYESFLSECTVYERLHEKRRSGFDQFPRLVLYGEVICSTVFPAGNILLLEKIDATPLHYLWDSLALVQRQRVYNECRNAVRVLRSIYIWVADTGKQNVLYSKESGKVVMVDFEAIGECLTEQDVQAMNGPEMYAIFGPQPFGEIGG